MPERSGGEAVGEAATGDQLHHQVGVRVLGAVDDVVDGHHVGVLEAGQGPCLAQHPFAQGAGALGVRGGGGRVGGADFLQGDLTVQGRVVRPPDHAHAPAAELPQRLEPAVDQRPLCPSRIHGGHRRGRRAAGIAGLRVWGPSP